MLSEAARTQLRQDLLRVIQGDTPAAIGEIGETTSLLQSGLVDSVRLLDLAVFVEHAIGLPVDLSGVDLERDWDTMGAILTFIENSQRDSSAAQRGS